MRRIRDIRITSVFAVAAAVTVAASACASSGTTGSGQGSGGTGQTMTLLAKMSAPQAVAASTKAVATKQSARMHMSVQAPNLTEVADGSVSIGSSMALDMTLQISSTDPQLSAQYSQLGNMEMRMTGMVAYLDMGNSQQMVAALQGKQWMKIDFNNLGNVPQLASFSFLKDMGKSNDPSTSLKSMLASPGLRKVGQEQRNGVQTLHFTGSVNPTDLVKASAASGLTQQDLDSLTALAKEAGVTNTTYDVWVDGSGLPVEIKFSEDTNAGAVSGDLVYSDWGTPVNVVAPPSDQTVDIAQLLQSQGAN